MNNAQNEKSAKLMKEGKRLLAILIFYEAFLALQSISLFSLVARGEAIPSVTGHFLRLGLTLLYLYTRKTIFVVLVGMWFAAECVLRLPDKPGAFQNGLLAVGLAIAFVFFFRAKRLLKSP